MKPHEKLICIRKSKRITQGKIANALGIHISTYCLKEKGKSRIWLDEWRTIAEALNVEVWDIEDEEDENQGVSRS